MCGIAGFFGYKEISQKKLHDAKMALEHRGPDDSGQYIYHSPSGLNLYFVHTRLAIIDETHKASQPMQYNDNILVFNGEIYNYIELREKLGKRGHTFTTAGDSEVFLKHLVEHGINGLELADGMWSFAWFDKDKESLYLSRDRFGEKPLYVFHGSKGTYFASSYNALFALLGEKPSINRNKLLTYLYGGYKLLYKNSDTFYERVEQVRPSYCMLLKEGRLKECSSYWNYSVQQNQSITLNDAIEGTKNILIDDLGLRLRSDVPIAFCMSGGIDSNSLISIAKKIYQYDVHGFTIYSPDDRYNENLLVDKAVSDLNIRHTYVNLRKNSFLSDLSLIINARKAPVYTISYYVHWLLMAKIASCGYKVSISGTGADELFTGYYDHFLLHMASIYTDKKAYLESYDFWKKYVDVYIRNPVLKNARLFIDNNQYRDHLSSDYASMLKYCPLDYKVEFSESKFCSDILRNRMLNELFCEVVPVIIDQDDLNSMYFSVENRSPFLSKRLFEFAQQIPSKLLVQNGYAKYILRESMKGIVTQDVLKARKKVGFNASIYDLIDLDSEEFNDFIGSASVIDDFVCRDELTKSLSDGTVSEKFLFNFICSKIFLDQHVE